MREISATAGHAKRTARKKRFGSRALHPAPLGLVTLLMQTALRTTACFHRQHDNGARDRQRLLRANDAQSTTGASTAAFETVSSRPQVISPPVYSSAARRQDDLPRNEGGHARASRHADRRRDGKTAINYPPRHCTRCPLNTFARSFLRRIDDDANAAIGRADRTLIFGGRCGHVDQCAQRCRAENFSPVIVDIASDARKESAPSLTALGLVIAPQTLARKYHEGTGPLCTHVGVRTISRASLSSV